MTVVQGNGNPFAGAYSDQCTYWAQERYHQLTGLWSPCTGNAADWATQARAAGWIVSSTPVVPSIVCFQPGVQLANPVYGHVAVVERINSDGSIYTSNFNYYPHIGDRVVVYANFQQGRGVSFIYANTNAVTSTPIQPVQSTDLTQAAKLSDSTTSPTHTPTPANISLPSLKLSANSGITDVLISIDDHLAMVNPFQVQGAQDTIKLPIVGSNVATFTSPVSWVEGFGNNLVVDLSSMVLRLLLIIIGFYIVYTALDQLFDMNTMVSNPQNTVKNTVKNTAFKVAKWAL